MSSGIQASMDSKSDFWKTLEWIAIHYREGVMDLANADPIATSEGVLGITGPHTDDEYPDEGEYIRVGFILPDGIYAEVDDGTYGTLNAFRIYKDGE